MTRFANLADGGAALVPLVRAAIADRPDPCIVAIMPNGVPAAAVLAAALGAQIIPATLHRDGEPHVDRLPDLMGRTAVVVDDGVETGTAARLVGSAARSAGASRVVLAVAVCPREAQAAMDRLYDEVIAVERPFVRRDLRWHYQDFDTIDEAEALRRLRESGHSLG